MNTNTVVAPGSQFLFTVEENAATNRLDSYITQQFPYYSRSYFQRMITNGLIKLNGQTIVKTGTTLKAGDVIEVTFPAEQKPEITPETTKHLAIRLIHTHEHFLIIYKPAGILVHAPHKDSTELTVVDWLLAHHAEIDGVGVADRPGIVHRLDKDTSGLLIVPRTNYGHGQFSTMFRERTIQKTYIAVVAGHPDKKGTIDLPIGRDPICKVRMATFDNKKMLKYPNVKLRTATTHFSVIDYKDDYSVVEVKPITGRTHQIRVHFAAVGHPLIGDTTYGTASKKIGRHALHAQGLSFTFNGTAFTFTQTEPADMQLLITQSSQK